MRRTAVVALTFGLLSAGCAAGRSTAPPPCPVSPVHRGAVPASVPDFAPGATGNPWMGDDEFVAVLFYSRGGGPDIPVGGQWRDIGLAAKILWWAPGAMGSLRVHGSEGSTARRFDQTVATVGSGQYPSTVNVPEPGCWTLTAAVAGRQVGSITVRAVQ